MEAASRCKSDRSSIWGSPSSKTNKAELWIRYSCRCRRKNSQIPSKYTEGGTRAVNFLQLWVYTQNEILCTTLFIHLVKDLPSLKFCLLSKRFVIVSSKKQLMVLNLPQDCREACRCISSDSFKPKANFCCCWSHPGRRIVCCWLGICTTGCSCLRQTSQQHFI